MGPLKTVRCRIQERGVEIQLGEDILETLETAQKKSLQTSIATLCEPHYQNAYIKFSPYKMGSAFLKDPARV